MQEEGHWGSSSVRMEALMHVWFLKINKERQNEGESFNLIAGLDTY